MAPPVSQVGRPPRGRDSSVRMGFHGSGGYHSHSDPHLALSQVVLRALLPGASLAAQGRVVKSSMVGVAFGLSSLPPPLVLWGPNELSAHSLSIRTREGMARSFGKSNYLRQPKQRVPGREIQKPFQVSPTGEAWRLTALRGCLSYSNEGG